MANCSEEFLLTDYVETNYTNCSLYTLQGDNTTQWQKDPGSVEDIMTLVFKGIIMSVIILVAFLGNVLVIVSIGLNRKLQVLTNYFLVSLAIADMLVASCAMTFNASVELSGKWCFGYLVCDLYNSFDVYFSTVSILNLCCISMDRYIAILKPLQYPIYMTKQVVRLMLAVVWLSPTLISFLPIFLGWYATQEHLELRAKEPDVCTFEVNTPYAFVSSSVSFWVPCTVMLVLYYRVFQEARKQETAILSRANSTHNLSNIKTSLKNSLNVRRILNILRPKKTPQANGEHSKQELPLYSIPIVTSCTERERTHSVYSEASFEVQIPCCTFKGGSPCKCSYRGAMSPSPTFLAVENRNELSPSSPVCSTHKTFYPKSSDAHLNEQLYHPPGLHNGHLQPRPSTASGIVGGNCRASSCSTPLMSHSSSVGNGPTMRREHKAAKTLGIVMGAFILCWLPFFTWYLTVNICGDSCQSPQELVATFFWIGYFNSTLNPFIYAYFRADFREAFKKTLKRLNCFSKSSYG